MALSISISQQSTSNQCAIANLANLLPTGTLAVFHVLVPIFTKNGSCDRITFIFTIILLTVLGASCSLACFTDSVKLGEGKVYYGLATRKGLWLFDRQAAAEASRSGNFFGEYSVVVIDFIHAILSFLLFAVVALGNKNVVACLLPMPVRDVQDVLGIVPIGVGVLCSLLFMVFPTRRHGLGHPVT